jgi:hypothetical protein
MLPKTEIKTNVPWIGTTPIPLGLLLVAAVHAFILIQLLRYRFVLYDIGYQWLALIAGYYVVSRPFKPGAPELRHEEDLDRLSTCLCFAWRIRLRCHRRARRPGARGFACEGSGRQTKLDRAQG